jgi:hypothetical protein
LKQVSVAADVDIYFCDPHSPWQRGTGENTNGLLRQYFPKGTDLSVHSPVDLDWVATELNDRPRKRLGFAKPIEEIGLLLLRSPREPRQPSANNGSWRARHVWRGAGAGTVPRAVGLVTTRAARHSLLSPSPRKRANGSRRLTVVSHHARPS